jgi:glucose/arabinose dehydrogenase
MAFTRTTLSTLVALVAGALACGCDAGLRGAAGEVSPQGSPAGCEALETRSPNAPDQRPELPGQTRACAAPSGAAFEVQVVARGLDHPGAVEPLPGGDLLVTEKEGRMRIVSESGAIGEPIAGGPEVGAGGQGGLLDVELSRRFASDRTLWWSYSEPRERGNGTSVARGVLSADRRRLENVTVVFRAEPSYDNGAHFGSRVLVGPDGMLYVTLGERSDRETRPQAQELGSHLGKIVRIRADGGVPADNPFVGRAGARPEIWSYGHRNVQAAAFDAQGQLWEVEHGPRGGDELNLVEKGKNYGWPLQSYGEEYSGAAIATAAGSRPGIVSPVYYWDPVIAPSGAQFYRGDLFPAWQGNLFVGALRDERLVRLVLDGGRVVGEEHLLTDRGQRIRDVREGPDGALYLVTDESNGELLRLVPRRAGGG